MSQPETPSRDQALIEKSQYLRLYSGALLGEAQEIIKASQELRKANLRLNEEMRLIRAVGYRFKPKNDLLYENLVEK